MNSALIRLYTLILTLIVGTPNALCNHQPDKGVHTEEIRAANSRSKIGMSKEQMGIFNGQRTFNGELDSADLMLGDGSYYELHTLTLRAGQTVEVGLSSSDFDCYLILAATVNNEVVVLSEDDDSGGGTDSSLSFQATQPGEYMVVVNSVEVNRQGNYTLVVHVHSGDGQSEVSSSVDQGMESGRIVGELTSATDDRLDDGSLYDLVEFEGQRGQRIEIELRSDDFDAILALFFQQDGELYQLADDDDSGDGTDSLIRLELPYSGAYVALVNAVGAQEAGAYQLHVSNVIQSEVAMADRDWSQVYPGGGSPDEQYALLVGIDDYPGFDNDLGSCIVDTHKMRQLLVDHLGFRQENIVIIHDNEATRDHIIEASRRHLSQAGPQGTAFFYYSGHGIQLDGNYGVSDSETDGKDEAIYVWGQDTQSSVLLDEELGTLIGELEAGQKVVMLDSCHSGTATLGPSYKWVDTKDATVRKHLVMPKSFLASKSSSINESAMLDGPVDHILLAACAPDQVASAGMGGVPSVFTRYFIESIQTHGADMTFEQLIDIVNERVDEHKKIATEVVQVPRVEGKERGRNILRVFYR